MEQATATRPRTAFDLVGGARLVRRVVDRFYDLMDADAEYAELRLLHAPDLSPMRDSLTGFLTAWLGGPGLVRRKARTLHDVSTQRRGDHRSFGTAMGGCDEPRGTRSR